ncbi:MAG: sigma-70 family RNA polymerase sigma factor [Clostridia bacterium]|nr:sigma-70 family RNA polymerase sigma factor [Clostridia bacterium]
MQEYTASDENIIALYFDRDENAITLTDQKYRKYLFVIAYNIVSDTEDSEECLSDTYYQTWNAIPPHRPKNLRAFLTRITRRLALDILRKRNAGKRIPDEYLTSLHELDETLSLPADSDSDALAKTLNDFLRKLPEKTRCIFVSRYYCADSVETIAHYMKMSESAVYKNLQHTKKALKKALEKEGFQL